MVKERPLIAENITDLIGHTPIVRLARIGAGLEAQILAKLESFNPLASLKDRIGLEMIEAAEQEGRITPATVIVEATSGNTGISLAFVCAVKGYKLIITMPDSMSDERKRLLAVFGTQLVMTPAKDGMLGALKKASEIATQNSNHLLLSQFTNPANTQAHRNTTAEEIWHDTGGQLDVLVAGVGTGGTLTGVGEVIKQRKPSIHLVAVEPQASPVLSGGKPGPHGIQGLGAGFIPDILNLRVVDEIMPVTKEEAVETCSRLAREEGILAGISSGAATWAAMEIAARPEMRGKIVLVILPDSGERYLSNALPA